MTTPITRQLPNRPDIPLTQLDADVMTSLASGFGTPFRLDGAGFVSALISCVDTTSADGEFYLCIGDASTDFAAGTYKQLAIPVVSKVAGAALVKEPLQCDKPGGRWGCIRYVRSAGGAAAEITVTVSAWASFA